MPSIADILPIGHRTGDSSREKRLKSAYAAVLLAVAVFSVSLALLPDRSRLEVSLDLAVVAMMALSLVVLHTAKNIHSSFICVMSFGLPIMAMFYFIHGNRDGDFYFFLLIPAAAVAFLGPKQSRIYFALTLAVAALILLIDPLLPKLKHAWHLTPMNPQGWLFHGQDKYLMKSTETATFFGVCSLVYLLLYSAASALQDANRRIEALLLNVLPRSVADRLMAGDAKGDPATIVESFDEVTILFADIVDFTRLSQSMAPGELVRLLNELFSAFDELAEKHDVEKIKTIGDAYMVVCGLPEPDARHAEKIADMALDMLAITQRFSETSGLSLRIRIGINSGSVIAGIIGRKKFIYDLWGDAVNTASRMEAHSAPGVIQTAAGTYDRLKDTYTFVSIGEIDLKGKGTYATWQLLGRREGAEG